MKGIDPQLASAAVSEAYEGQEPVARARKLLGGSDTTTRSGRDRAIRKLLGRGYDMGTALKALDDPERQG
jgi:SOS response regulatory protein OraA/RecX